MRDYVTGFVLLVETEECDWKFRVEGLGIACKAGYHGQGTRRKSKARGLNKSEGKY